MEIILLVNEEAVVASAVVLVDWTVGTKSSLPSSLVPELSKVLEKQNFCRISRIIII